MKISELIKAIFIDGRAPNQNDKLGVWAIQDQVADAALKRAEARVASARTEVQEAEADLGEAETPDEEVAAQARVAAADTELEEAQAELVLAKEEAITAGPRCKLTAIRNAVRRVPTQVVLQRESVHQYMRRTFNRGYVIILVLAALAMLFLRLHREV